MAEMVEYRTVSCTAKGIVKQIIHAVTMQHVDGVADDAGYSQYVVIARSGDKCGDTLVSADFPYNGDVEIVAYNAAKRV